MTSDERSDRIDGIDRSSIWDMTEAGHIEIVHSDAGPAESDTEADGDQAPVEDGKTPVTLPILPLKETVVFPDTMMPLAVGQPRSVPVSYTHLTLPTILRV